MQITPNRSFRNLDHLHESAKQQKATAFMKIIILTNLPNYSPLGRSVNIPEMPLKWNKCTFNEVEKAFSFEILSWDNEFSVVYICCLDCLTGNEWVKREFNTEETVFFFKKKIQNGQLKKTEFFKTAKSQYFFTKILGIDSWRRALIFGHSIWSSGFPT